MHKSLKMCSAFSLTPSLYIKFVTMRNNFFNTLIPAPASPKMHRNPIFEQVLEFFLVKTIKILSQPGIFCQNVKKIVM